MRPDDLIPAAMVKERLAEAYRRGITRGHSEAVAVLGAGRVRTFSDDLPASKPALGSPGAPELAVVMMDAYAAGDDDTLAALAELADDPDGLAEFVADVEGGTHGLSGLVKQFAAGVKCFGWAADPTKRSKTRVTNSESGAHAYGKRAQQLLAAQGRADRGEPEPPHPARAKAQQLKAEREPAREAGRSAWAKATTDPAALTHADLADLHAHLHSLTRDEVREQVKAIRGGGHGGKLKAELVDALTAHAKELVAHERGKEGVLKEAMAGYLGMNPKATDADVMDRFGRGRPDAAGRVLAELRGHKEAVFGGKEKESASAVASPAPAPAPAAPPPAEWDAGEGKASPGPETSTTTAAPATPAAGDAATVAKPARPVDPDRPKVEYVRAPAGGQVSDVDGRHYAGGQLMPTHGLYAGQPKPPKGTGVGTGDPVKPNEDAEGGSRRQPARPLTPEQIAERHRQAEDQRKWDEMNAGPLGKVTWLGEKPNSKGMSGWTELKKWREHAESIGPDGVTHIISTLEPELHRAIDGGFAARRAEDQKKKDEGRWSDDHDRDIPADMEQWHKDNLKTRGAEAIGMFAGSKGHEKKVPGSHYARELVHEMMDPQNHPPGTSKIDIMHRVNGILAGKPAAPHPAAAHAATLPEGSPARAAIEAAVHNGNGDPRRTLKELGHRHAEMAGQMSADEEAGYVRMMEGLGVKPLHAPGEVKPFDPATMQSDTGISTGTPVKVTRRGWTGLYGDAKTGHELTGNNWQRAAVEPAGKTARAGDTVAGGGDNATVPVTPAGGGGKPPVTPPVATSGGNDPLPDPPDGKGVPAGHEYLGVTHGGLPVFSGPHPYKPGAKRVYIRDVTGQMNAADQFNPAKHLAPDAVRDAAAAAAQAKATEAKQQQEAEQKARNELYAKQQEESARQQAEYQTRREAEAVAQAEQQRAKDADRQNRVANHNHLDFHAAAHDPHRVTEGVPSGHVRLTAGPTNLGRSGRKGDTKWKSGYVAKITGRGGQYGLERQFVTQKGGGSPVSADVGDGVYEVGTGAGKNETAKHFVHVQGGKARVVDDDEAHTLIPDTPAEAARKTNTTRPPIGPAVSHTLEGDRPQVGHLFMRDGVPHVVTAIGRSNHWTAEEREDMDDFGHPGGWETSVTAHPVEWREGDPETPAQATERRGREKTEAERVRAVFAAHPAAPTERPPDGHGEVLKGGSLYQPDYVIAPDGIYESRYDVDPLTDFHDFYWYKRDRTPELEAEVRAIHARRFRK